MKKLIEHFDKQTKKSLLFRSYLSILLIFILDFITGAELSLLVLYMFPISIISWFVSKKQGLVVASICSLVNLVNKQISLEANYALSVIDLITIWNLLQTLIIFASFSFMISTIKIFQLAKSNGEILLAQKVQNFLLPQSAPAMKYFNYSGRKKSYNNFSGDFYDYILITPDHLMIIIGDICGSGISAALLMAHIHGVIRSRPHTINDLTELMNTINKSLHNSTDEDKFATLFIGVYNDSEKNIEYVNAGHIPPFILRNNRLIKLYNEGLLLGVDATVKYNSNTVKLEKNDLLFFYTDGITESRNYKKEFYGEKRLVKEILLNKDNSPDDISKSILTDIEKFIGMETQKDDITMIVGKIS